MQVQDFTSDMELILKKLLSAVSTAASAPVSTFSRFSISLTHSLPLPLPTCRRCLPRYVASLIRA